MQLRNDNSTTLSAELRILPAWAWGLAVIGFVVPQLLFDLFIGRDPNAPPTWARPLLGLLVGMVCGVYLLFIAYINRDAKRRAMSALLWTLIAILIPNGLGILLYFVLRQPLCSACPQCGYAVQSGFSFCPHCSCKLTPSCPQCQRSVGTNDLYCPYCGTSLHAPSAPAHPAQPPA